MFALRANRIISSFINNSPKSLRCGVSLARYASQSSDVEPNKLNSEGDQKGPKNILDKMSKTLSDVPTKAKNKGENLAKLSMEKISGSIGAFDDLLGISAVREAQTKVREAEDSFMNFRKNVQDAEKELELVRTQLNDVRKRLDRVSRDDERYLSFATEEHTILLEEKKLKGILKDYENQERDQFAVLSLLVRESHEKERERVERTKHWSVVGSIVGAAIGVISSTVINYIRLKEVKNSVRKSEKELLEKSSELLSLLTSQDDKLAANNNEVKETLQVHRDDIANQLEELRSSVDTYALSASIGTDVGTLEAGISLKSLTAQLKELVQMQLARERREIEGHEQSSNTDIQEQIYNLKEDNREHFAELFVGLQSLATKLELLQKRKVDNEPVNNGAVEHLDIEAQEYSKKIEHAQYWSKIQTGASVVSMAMTLVLIIREFSIG